MKKLIVFALVIFSTTFVFAQEDQVAKAIQMIEVTEGDRSMNGSTENALMMDLPSDEKVALRVWKEYLKGHGSKTKKVKKSDEWYSPSARIESVNSDDPVDVYAKIERGASGSEITIWLEMGDFYVSSAAFPNDYNAAQTFLRGYHRAVQKDLTLTELKEEQKSLKKLEEKLKALQKRKEGYHKEIEDAKAKIKKAEDNIVQNEKDQVDAGKAIATQKEIVERVKKKLEDM